MNLRTEIDSDPFAPLFNSTLFAAALSTAFELRLLEQFERGPGICRSELYEKLGISGGSADILLRLLDELGVLVLPADQAHAVTPGLHFRAAFKTKGYFHWLLRGHGALLNQWAQQCRQNARQRTDWCEIRDHKAIALAGRDYGCQYVDDIFLNVLNGTGGRNLMDLGCGSAGRIIECCRRDESLRAWGIDGSVQAVRTAERQLAKENLSRRIQVCFGNVTELAECKEWESIDVISMFFMGHDLWPQARCVATLDHLARVFPRADYFLFADTYKSDAPSILRSPVFTQGFEVTHELMGQVIPTKEEWLATFEQSQWKLEQVVSLGIAFTDLFVLRRRKQGI